jgi:hypothetical protein
MSDVGQFGINAMLCDTAVVAEGKLFIQGAGWNALNTMQFPCVHPRLGLALIVSVPYTATNQLHTMEITLVHEDGEELVLGAAQQPDGQQQQLRHITAQFNVGRPPTILPGDAQVMPFAVNLNQLQFEKPGSYSVVLKIDGTVCETLVFRVGLPVGQTIAA